MGMVMIRWEWAGNGNKKVIPANLPTVDASYAPEYFIILLAPTTVISSQLSLRSCSNRDWVVQRTRRKIAERRFTLLHFHGIGSELNWNSRVRRLLSRNIWTLCRFALPVSLNT